MLPALREAQRRCKGQTCAWGPPQEHASWGINADLLVQLVLREGELHSLADLLLLNVIASNVLHMAQENEHRTDSHASMPRRNDKRPLHL